MIGRIRRSDVALHGAFVFLGIFASNVLSYLFYMLIGRRGGVVIYGEVTSLISAILVLGAPANVLQLIAARIAADLDASQNVAGLRRLARAMTGWTALAGALIVAAAVVFRGPVAGFFHITDSRSVVLAGVSLGLYWMAYGQRGVLQGAHRFGDLSISLAAEAATKVVAGVWLVGAFGTAGALGGFTIALAVGALYNLVRFRRLFGTGTAGSPFDRGTVERIVRGVGVGQLTLTALTFYDVPLVKHIFDARSAGLYAAAALVGRVVIAGNAFIPTIVLPKAAARVAAGRSATPLLLTGIGLAATCDVLLLAVCLVAPRVVVSAIAGGAFADASYLVAPYVAAAGALSIAMVAAAYNFALHRYAFVVPMFVFAAAEAVTVSLWHPSLIAVVGVVCAGHGCVLLATLYGIVGRRADGVLDPELTQGPVPVGVEVKS